MTFDVFMIDVFLCSCTTFSVRFDFQCFYFFEVANLKKKTNKKHSRWFGFERGWPPQLNVCGAKKRLGRWNPLWLLYIYKLIRFFCCCFIVCFVVPSVASIAPFFHFSILPFSFFLTFSSGDSAWTKQKGW